MRVTNRMMVDGMMRNINNALKRLDKKYDELSTGRQFRYPSDNPVGVSQAMKLNISVEETKQYIKNADDAILWMESTDNALSEYGKVILRIKDLAVTGANSTLPDDSREALADEVHELRDHLIMLSNSEQEGRYLFAGTQNNRAPFIKQPDGTVLYQGNSQSVQTELGIGVTMDVNVTGDQAFGAVDGLPAGVNDVFEFLTGFEEDLRTGDLDAVENSIAIIENYNNNLLRYRSEMGAKVNRMEMNKERLEGLKLNYEKILSNVQDIDLAKSVMELKMMESVQQAALSTGARIIQPTLVDYIK